MDWSLVLISQGIAATIHEPGETAPWELEVEAEDYSSALAAIRLYKKENRGWAWRREFAVPGFVFDWGCLAWLSVIVVFHWATAQSYGLVKAGLMDAAQVQAGQWWRVFTAVWLHADVGHLAGNATMGMVLLGLAMGLYGTGTGLFLAYLSGVGGNLLVYAIATGPRSSLGASGLVMGCLGLLAVQPFAWARKPHRVRVLLGAAAGGLMLFVLLGLAPGTDVLAHLGGFLSGMVLGTLCAYLGPKPESSRANLLAGLLFGILTLGPWLAAFNWLQAGR